MYGNPFHPGSFIPIRKDEYKSRLTSEITRGAQNGYHQRLDTSKSNTYITSLKMCIHILAPTVYIT